MANARLASALEQAGKATELENDGDYKGAIQLLDAAIHDLEFVLKKFQDPRSIQLIQKEVADLRQRREEAQSRIATEAPKEPPSQTELSLEERFAKLYKKPTLEERFKTLQTGGKEIADEDELRKRFQNLPAPENRKEEAPTVQDPHDQLVNDILKKAEADYLVSQKQEASEDIDIDGYAKVSEFSNAFLSHATSGDIDDDEQVSKIIQQTRDYVKAGIDDHPRKEQRPSKKGGDNSDSDISSDESSTSEDTTSDDSSSDSSTQRAAKKYVKYKKILEKKGKLKKTR